MKITKITAQVKRPDRYSIFVDDAYAFSLSADLLLDSHIASGDELTEQQVKQFKQLSADDKMYSLVIRYIALRPRTRWEIETYLDRKDSPAPLTEQITNKLEKLELIDDLKFARAFVNDRRLLRPTSRRKMILELQKKHVASDIIQQAVGSEGEDERAALKDIVRRKRLQSRYKDELKLMQYLARQGFNYGDIKAALGSDEDY